MNRQSLSLALLISASILTHPLHASFAQRKDGITLRVRDFSPQQDRKLIGSEIGAREMRELNAHGIYPVLIELKNRSEESFVFGPQNISVPIYSPLQMAFRVPVICGKSVLAAIGGIFSLCGGIFAGGFTWAHACDRHDLFVINNAKTKCTCGGVKIGSASTLALFYLGIKGLMYSCKKDSDQKKDQGTWLNHWMLQLAGAVLKPNARVKKFIFLDKKTYQKGGFRLTLNALHGPNMSFDVSLLP